VAVRFRERVWHDLEWAGGGVDFSRRLYITCTVLTPRPDIRDELRRLDDKWLDSSAGSSTLLGGRLDQLEEYRDDLRAMSLDCNYTYLDFAEAIYPIDLEPGVLARLCVDELPAELDDLVEAVGFAGEGRWLEDPWASHMFADHWQLFLLGANCD
jgi:hypothetical protein